MQRPSITILTLLVVAAFTVQQIAARCNACNDNGIACISETSFQLCFKGERDTTQELTCPGDTICVARGSRCMERDQGFAPECQLSTICGKCDGLNMFTCTSRTTFAQCNGTEPMPNTGGRCPAGLVCDTLQPEICVSECKAPENLQCTNDAPL